MEVIAGRGLYQIYPGGVLANEDVNLSVEKGEIHALVGENGAGQVQHRAGRGFIHKIFLVKGSIPQEFLICKEET